jgi:hypothetical protein
VSDKLRTQLGLNPPHVDLWLVVVKQEANGGGDASFHGLGTTITAVFGSSAYTVFSISAVAVLDGTTLQPLAFPDLRLAKPEFMAQHYPVEIVDQPAPDIESWNQAPEEWRQNVRAKIEDQLRRSIAYTIPALGLGR